MSTEGFDPGDVIYRIAYGAASRLSEQHRQGADWSDTSPAVTTRILAAVARQLGRDTADPNIVEAVEDAIAQRNPRW